MTWPKYRDALLQNADATAAVGVQLMQLAQQLKDADAYSVRDFITEALADDPSALALLQRNIRAHESMIAGLKEMRNRPHGRPGRGEGEPGAPVTVTC